MLTFLFFYCIIINVLRTQQKTNTCGCSSVVEHQPSKLDMWVRFPSPALMREWLSWWSATLPRSRPRVRVPSRAFFISKMHYVTKNLAYRIFPFMILYAVFSRNFFYVQPHKSFPIISFLPWSVV